MWNEPTHLNKRVDDTDIGTGVKDLVESRLSVDQLQLVELLVILYKKNDNMLQSNSTPIKTHSTILLSVCQHTFLIVTVS